MVAAVDAEEDRYRRAAERRRIPPVPDLRFEYSYTRSVAPYVKLDYPSPSATERSKGKEKATDTVEGAGEAAATVGTEVVQVQWGNVLWVTMRDQVISPLAQGALWGVAGHFLTPLGASIGARVRSWWSRGGIAGKGASMPEGNMSQYLRGSLGKVLTPTPAANYTR
ncbi:uncharacterized protein BXZ73DRAFT_88105 [Epithele typhae]|uniref:uncharacterized protein n=1 Tax=Epithele typhae TaxID=378194 RepID=UPI002007CAB9|nr:uncharacterized protein BXZ73DRAFT_88105 [Epithele typhae]KAH9941594.1 hypothetical protein BXZ73DRAFT_88105 [Epithele typhae]